MKRHKKFRLRFRKNRIIRVTYLKRLIEENCKR